MSQTATFVVIDDGEVFEVAVNETANSPTYEDIEALCDGFDIYGDINANYVHYEIGEGESNTDYFFTDDELISMWGVTQESDQFEKAIEDKGYELNRIQYGVVTMSYERSD